MHGQSPSTQLIHSPMLFNIIQSFGLAFSFIIFVVTVYYTWTLVREQRRLNIRGTGNVMAAILQNGTLFCVNRHICFSLIGLLGRYSVFRASFQAYPYPFWYLYGILFVSYIFIYGVVSVVCINVSNNHKDDAYIPYPDDPLASTK